MRNITVKGLRKAFAGRIVLSNVDFALSEESRLALVGENGAGKSTLLRILSRQLEPDAGEMYGLENGCAYVAQDFSGDPNQTPEQFLASRIKDVRRALPLLEQSGFDLGKDGEKLRNCKCGDLSGGEQKKLEIIAGLVRGSLFLALDEPENHLDYLTIEWLIRSLKKFKGGLVFVSHDQYLIDELADSILELEEGSVVTYSMRYDEYLAEKERQVAGEARQWMMEKKTIHRLRETVAMMKLRASRSSDTAATYRQTKRRLQRLEEEHDSKRPTAEQDKPRVRLGTVEQKRGKQIVVVEHLDFSYGAHVIFRDANADLRFGEKVVLFGRNGSGKSTLVHLLIGELHPQHGVARIGVNIRWQMMSQDHLEGINPEASSLQVFRESLGWPEARSRATLAKYGISAQLVNRPLQVLSGGQRARFKLALTFAHDPEFLILDEPTNHVDPTTWEAIVEAIQGYSGTVLAITHDRMFIDAIASSLWLLENRKIQAYPGNVSDYLKR